MSSLPSVAGGGTLRFPSSSVLQLISLHLISCGYTGAADALQAESRVGLPGTVQPIKQSCSHGRWGQVLQDINRLDEAVLDRIPDALLLEVKEMAVLEMCEVDRAAALLCYRALDNGRGIFRGEQKSRVDRAVGIDGASAPSQVCYGSVGKKTASMQDRRDDIGNRLGRHVPTAPEGRLMSLIGQAMQWQRHTGTIPVADQAENDDPAQTFPMSFDLVTGKPPDFATQRPGNPALAKVDAAPTQQYGVVKFAKKTCPQTCAFLPDGSSLLTGSSDGFVEVWDYTTCKLRVHDLPYQAKDEIMLHNCKVLSVCCSRDATMLGTGDEEGCVKVWALMSGKCLRKFEHAHTKAVLTLTFVKDGSKVLTGSQDSLIREFGLRSTKMTQEFSGHSSYVNSVSLVKEDSLLLSCSSDGSVKIWHRDTAQCFKTLTAPSPSGSLHGSVPINAVLPISSEGDNLLLLPAGPVACVMSVKSGEVLRQFKADSGEFSCATISPRGRFLYAVSNDGSKSILHCFDIATGSVEKTLEIADYEVLGIAHHPTKNLIATWANEGNRGKVKMWVP